MTVFSPSGLGRGLSVAEWSIVCINRTGATLTLGEACVLDFLTTSAGGPADEVDADAFNTGTDDDPVANVVTVTAVGAAGTSAAMTSEGAICVLCAEDSLADNDAGRFWVQHPNVAAQVVTGVVAGDALTLATTAVRTLIEGTQASTALLSGESAKIVGLAYEADDAGTPARSNIMFNGFSGFGQIVGLT